jgi:GPN-loop GTPase
MAAPESSSGKPILVPDAVDNTPRRTEGWDGGEAVRSSGVDVGSGDAEIEASVERVHAMAGGLLRSEASASSFTTSGRTAAPTVATEAASGPPPIPRPPPPGGKAVCCIVLGMAGSGKTTLLQRLNSYSHSQGLPPYLLNLDPAVRYLPFTPNIDIRDTVNYKEVMKQYGLGPNGAIMTSLNLFSTRFDEVSHQMMAYFRGGQHAGVAVRDSFDCPASLAMCSLSLPLFSTQVMTIIEKRAQDVHHIFVDTPGQIEVFTWSASGSIITQAIASSLPTVLVYVIDTPRTTAPVTFM